MIKIRTVPDRFQNHSEDFLSREELVLPTIFPDGTSQVWKLSSTLTSQIISFHGIVEIHWKFEKESELFQVCQLAQLLITIGKNIKVKLVVPYLPYGRQDKEISNDSCFAQYTFWKIITSFFHSVETLDIHSEAATKTINSLAKDLEIILRTANPYIKTTIYECRPALICFPDKGASQRGYDTQGLESFNLEKDRDPLTGEIRGLKSPLPLNLQGQKILILDDICDGGRTFIDAAKVLYNMGAEEVYLYVTHGIFSKGTQVLFDAGIKRIFTYEGEVK